MGKRSTLVYAIVFVGAISFCLNVFFVASKINCCVTNQSSEHKNESNSVNRLVLFTQEEKAPGGKATKITDALSVTAGLNSPDDEVILPLNFLQNVEAHNATERFLLRPKTIEEVLAGSRGHVFLLIVVKSACHLRKRRDSVRTTWGAVEQINEKRLAVVFLVGKGDPSCQDQTKEEASQFGDILQADIPDDYRNLPDKVLSGYQWVAQELAQDACDFYVFADDDLMLNVAAVVQYFYPGRKTLAGKNSFHCGMKMAVGGSPIRAEEAIATSVKYTVSNETFPELYYPNFCHGGMVALARPLLDRIYATSMVTDRGDFHLEDVYITGILRHKMLRTQRGGIMPIQSRGKGTAQLVWHFQDPSLQEKATGLVWSALLRTVQCRVGDQVWKANPRLNYPTRFTLNARALPLLERTLGKPVVPLPLYDLDQKEYNGEDDFV